MLYIQQVRTRKETLVPLRDSMDDNSMTSSEGDPNIKIEIVDLCNMGEISFDTEDQVIEVVTSPGQLLSSGGESSRDENPRPRKRAKLDHLSMEQKAQHRKMMNRISAQSARDRQRSLMQQQEETINSLSITNDVLQKENKKLKTMNDKLMAEKASENEARTKVEEENQRLQKLVAELEIKLVENVRARESLTSSMNGVKVCSKCPTSEPAEGTGPTTDFNVHSSDVDIFDNMDMDTPEILKALEHFSQQILCQDTDFTSLEQAFEGGEGTNTGTTNSPVAHSFTGTVGSGSIKIEDTGLAAEEPKSINFSEHVVIKEDPVNGDTGFLSVNSASPFAPLPLVEPEFGFLSVASPPLSPAMYSPAATANTSTSTLSKGFGEHSFNLTNKVDEFNDFIDSGYLYEPDNWASPESIHSEELFPELSF